MADCPCRAFVALTLPVYETTHEPALTQQVFAAILFSPGARDYYDQRRAGDAGPHHALHALTNRLVGILRG